MDLSGKVAVVTGGSRGIGKCVCLELGRAGAAIVILDVVQDVLDQAVAELNGTGIKTTGHKVDVSDPAAVEAVVEKITENGGRIDILVNNAGITRDNLLLRMTDEEWDLVQKVNLKGTFNLTRAVGRIMLSQRSGSIVNLASVSGIMGGYGQANYSASKAGVIALTKVAARELAKRGIRVNAVAPGFIATAMTEVLGEPVKAKYIELTPLARMGKPEEVAKAIRFLASDDASFITGQVLKVDGGMVM